MSKKVLVAYASKCGSTGEVAQAIGQVLCDQGLQADVRPAKEVRQLEGYDAVVLGSAVRMGKPLGAARKLAERVAKEMAGRPYATFICCMALHEDTSENRTAAEAAAAGLALGAQPVSTGLFAGVFAPERLEPLMRWMLSQPASPKMPTGDFRDWEAIRAWAGALSAALA